MLLNAETVRAYQAHAQSTKKALSPCLGLIPRGSRKGNGFSVDGLRAFAFCASSGGRELQRLPSDLHGSKLDKHRPAEYPSLVPTRRDGDLSEQAAWYGDGSDKQRVSAPLGPWACSHRSGGRLAK
jgi:hypothetical protein